MSIHVVPTITPAPYGAGTLSEVLSSAGAALGVAGAEDVFGFGPVDGICVLVVDGLGWVQLQEHAERAPFLAELAAGSDPLTVGFPATTSSAIGSIATGLAPGRHGLVSYSVRVPRLQDNLNLITWRTQSHGESALERYPPEELQPYPTLFERLAGKDLPVTGVLPASIRDSGLSRVSMRGLEFKPVIAQGELVATVAEAAATGSRLIYTYISELDTVGHRHGPGSDFWQEQLQATDALVRRLAARLPAGYRLVVTADHRMSWVDRTRSIDLDTGPAILGEGLSAVAGERRARYLYTEDPEAVAGRWAEFLGDDFLVVMRDNAIASGWFGPEVREDVVHLIGDVIVCSLGTRAILRSVGEPESMGPGTHGSVSDSDRLVPILTALA